MPRSRSKSMESSICSARIALVDGVALLQQPVGEGGLAVVDMGDDGKVADVG